MDILLLCGYFNEVHQEEIVRKTTTTVENAANTFQRRLISGFCNASEHVRIISAPFIGAWPTAYQDIYFDGFETPEPQDSKIEYVKFCNIWGFRNISRANEIKRSVRKFLAQNKEKEKLIVVYSPHTPFLEGAAYAKKMDPNIKICMVVPDLPQYMNLSKKAHPIYDFFKKVDISIFMKLNKLVDFYMLLTEYMAQPMDVTNRAYIVVEGIVDKATTPTPTKSHSGVQIAYAGKLNETFGVRQLVEAFQLIENPDISLEICGGGELKDYICNMVDKDSRIHYHGMVTAAEASRILQEADILVNPRKNDEEYTKYSFPSKNIEYIMTGNAVVAYMLDGMPEQYNNYVTSPDGEDGNALKLTLEKMIDDPKKYSEKSTKGIQYILNHLVAEQVAERILKMATK